MKSARNGPRVREGAALLGFVVLCLAVAAAPSSTVRPF